MKKEQSGLKERMVDFAFEIIKTEKVPTKEEPKKEEKK